MAWASLKYDDPSPLVPSNASDIWLQQSLGWEHYEVHEPEPHILLFKYISPDPYQQVLR